jgi:hypothetical protein
MNTFTIRLRQQHHGLRLPRRGPGPDIAGAEYFSSLEELEQLAESWPVAGARGGRGRSKLLELWNSIPSVAPVKKFESRTKHMDLLRQARARWRPVLPKRGTLGVWTEHSAGSQIGGAADRAVVR